MLTTQKYCKVRPDFISVYFKNDFAIFYDFAYGYLQVDPAIRYVYLALAFKAQ